MIEIIIHASNVYTTLTTADQEQTALSWVTSVNFDKPCATLDKLCRAIPKIASPALNAFEAWVHQSRKVEDLHIDRLYDFTDYEGEAFTILYLNWETPGS